MRDGEEVSRRAHNPKVGGSIPPPATKIYTIKRKFKGVETAYNIYPLSEFKGEAVPWRESKAGDWALTDDNYVAECLACRIYTANEEIIGHFRRFAFAKVWMKEGDTLEFNRYLPYLEGNKLRRKKTWQEYEAAQTRTKTLVSLYVKQLLAGKLDYKLLGTVYRPDQKIPEATVRRVLKESKIKEMIDKELDKALSDEGITNDYIIKLAKRAVELATGDKTPRPQVLLDVAKFFRDLLNEKNKPDQIQAFEYGITREISQDVDNAEKELSKLKAAQTAEGKQDE